MFFKRQTRFWRVIVLKQFFFLFSSLFSDYKIFWLQTKKKIYADVFNVIKMPASVQMCYTRSLNHNVVIAKENSWSISSLLNEFGFVCTFFFANDLFDSEINDIQIHKMKKIFSDSFLMSRIIRPCINHIELCKIFPILTHIFFLHFIFIFHEYYYHMVF